MTTTRPATVLDRLGPALRLIRANAAEADRTGVFAAENIDALREAGAFRWSCARSLGGDEISAVDRVAATEALGAADLTTIWIFANYDSHVWSLSGRLLADVSSVAESVLRNEEACCGTAAPIPGSVLEGDEIVVNGRFNFTTGWRQAKWLRAMVGVPGPAPEAPPAADPPRFHARHVMVPLDRPEVRVQHTWDAVGLRASQTDTIVVEGLRLPQDYSAPFVPDIDRQDEGVAVPSPYYREPGWALANSNVGTSLAGAAAEAYRLAHDYTMGGRALFSGRAPARFPGVRAAMVDAWVTLQTALRLMRAQAAESDARVAAQARWGTGDEASIWAAGMVSAQASLRVVDQLSLALGGSSAQKALPFERLFRDVRTGALHLGVHPSLVHDRVEAHLFPDATR